MTCVYSRLSARLGADILCPKLNVAEGVIFVAEIKIAVACHKPSELPDNPIYCPIQVGSALAKIRMPNMLHDDEGDNISEKNPTYCELTAQYWFWKNVDADYLGLCHYRRFLTFAEGDFEFNERNQIPAGFIDDYNKRRFGLEDSERMHAIIEANDCVVGELENVSKLNTPLGRQKTAYKHWAAHDRDLINVNDLNRMIEIVDEFYPQYSKEMHDYLDGPVFLGYNVFVMKKALFTEMCDFEFDVLSRLEREVDLGHYNQMRNRIFGFMAEILYSVFVYHLENEGYRVKHLPLVYFNVTDPLSSFELNPVANSIPVVFNAVELGFDQTLLGVTLRSFLKSCGPTEQYDVIMLHRSLDTNVKSDLEILCAGKSNVSLRFIDLSLIDEGLFDRVGYSNKKINDEINKISVSPELILPWILPKYSRVLSVEWHTLFNSPVKMIWDQQADDSACILAAPNLVELARINTTFQNKYRFARRTLGMSDPYSFFDSSAMVLELDRMRVDQDLRSIIALYKNQHFDLWPCDAFNSVYEGRVTYLSFKHVYPVIAESWRKYIVQFAPLSYYKDFQEVDDACVIQYDPAMYSDPQPGYAMVAFWDLARESPFYETILFNQLDLRLQSNLERKKPIRRFIYEKLPIGGNARQKVARTAGSILSVIYPKGTKRRAKIERTWVNSWMKSRLLRYID